MIEPIKIFSKCTGINNRIDPKRLNDNIQQTGLSELAEGVNVDIDDSGLVMSRFGQSSISTGAWHSTFCDKGDCFAIKNNVSEDLLYRINNDFSLTGVRSGLTVGARVSFCQVGADTYYMNGFQSGKITDAASFSWPGYLHVGVDTLRHFSPAPLGTHICYFQDCMWIVVGSTIFVSEPFAVGKFRLAAKGFPFGTDVRMIKPVKTGIWVSDSEKTGFILAGEKFEQMFFAKKSPFPAHEWSENIELVDLSQTELQIPGLSAIWSSDAGLCIGTEEGQLIVSTEKKLIYPTGSLGATVVNGHNVINSVY